MVSKTALAVKGALWGLPFGVQIWLEQRVGEPRAIPPGSKTL